ncbi:MAG: alpha/beta hydrolase [Solirubrobacteraceae bacterium]
MRADHINLADGRRLSYAETGPRHGFPVVYCHGAIGSSLERSVALEAITWELGVRYVTVSRPGFGASDCSPGRSVLGFAADVRQLADALALQRFGVLGVSAGGAYALALAYALPGRVERVALCSALSPLWPHQAGGISLRNGLALRFLARAPGACAALGDAMLPLIRRHPDLLSRLIAVHAAPSERPRLSEPAERRAASTSFIEASAGGVRGMVDDYLTCARYWGFSPADIDAEVHLWHGLTDRLICIDDALALAASLPRCRIFVDLNEGHHFFRRRLAEILATLVDGRVHRGVAAKSAA